MVLLKIRASRRIALWSRGASEGLAAYDEHVTGVAGYNCWGPFTCDNWHVTTSVTATIEMQ